MSTDCTFDNLSNSSVNTPPHPLTGPWFVIFKDLGSYATAWDCMVLSVNVLNRIQPCILVRSFDLGSLSLSSLAGPDPFPASIFHYDFIGHRKINR